MVSNLCSPFVRHPTGLFLATELADEQLAMKLTEAPDKRDRLPVLFHLLVAKIDHFLLRGAYSTIVRGCSCRQK